MSYGIFLCRTRSVKGHRTWHLYDSKGQQWESPNNEEPELEPRRYWQVPAKLCRCLAGDGDPMLYLGQECSPACLELAENHVVLAEGTYDSLWEMFLDYARML